MIRTPNKLTFVLALSLVAGSALAGTMERISEAGVIRLGFRVDAPPFASALPSGEPTGYSIELCKAVALDLRDQPGLGKLHIEWVPVGTENRFDAITNGRIDLLCGATTATLDRREIVDFSISTFIDGGSVLLPFDGPDSFDQLGGGTVGVRGGTTTEVALRDRLRETGVVAQVVPVESHDDGVARLASGAIDAYFADQSILISLAAQSAAPLKLSEEVFTVEPYALALRRGDDSFRLAVDRTLSRLYRSGDIYATFTDAFGSKARPGPLVEALYTVSALPE